MCDDKVKYISLKQIVREYKKQKRNDINRSTNYKSMLPKEKAHELFNNYYSYTWQVHKSTRSYKQTSMSKSAAKWCANDAVDLILYELKQYGLHCSSGIDYYNKVKQEINKL